MAIGDRNGWAIAKTDALNVFPDGTWCEAALAAPKGNFDALRDHGDFFGWDPSHSGWRLPFGLEEYREGVWPGAGMDPGGYVVLPTGIWYDHAAIAVIPDADGQWTVAAQLCTAPL